MINLLFLEIAGNSTAAHVLSGSLSQSRASERIVGYPIAICTLLTDTKPDVT